MKSYLFIFGILIVVISILVTLNIFFQQSLELEMAEQFSHQQLLTSSSIADNISNYIQFLKEEAIEIAIDMSNKPFNKETFNYIFNRELQHIGMERLNIGIIDTKGDFLYLRGDRPIQNDFVDEIIGAGKKLKKGESEITTTTSLISIVSPIYKANNLQAVIFLSFTYNEIANRFFDKLKLPEKGYVWIMDKDGNLLYHPTQPSMVGGNIYKSNTSCFRCHKDFNLQKDIIEGKAGDYGRYIAPTGEDKIIAFSNVSVDKISWIVAVSAPYSEITRATRHSMRLYSYLIIFIFSATSIISGMLIIFNKKRIKGEEAAKRKEELEKYALQLEEKVYERTQELESEKEKLHTIVSAIGVGIMLTDKNGVIQWTNQMLRDMAGDDITGKSCDDICPDCNISGEHLIENIETGILTNLFGEKDKYFQVTTAPVKSFTGELHGYIKVIQDITELKKMEDQMIQSEKLASIGRLAAGIAHEIGNPLTSIFSFIQILREMEEDEFKKDSLETIYFHINRISEIIKQLSGFSKMPAGEPKKCRINEIIETSVNLIHFDKRAKNITIVKKLGDNLPEITTDANQLSQVFVNLILNAIDAMPDGGTLTVSSLLDGQNIVIKFEDTGVGISKKDLKKIFDPFYTTKEKGTGLGLAVSYNIIKKLKGTINVESEENKGTVFTIILPSNNNS